MVAVISESLEAADVLLFVEATGMSLNFIEGELTGDAGRCALGRGSES